MAKINVTVTHKLGKTEALARIKKLLAEVKAEYKDDIKDLKENWSRNVGTFSFSVKGLSTSGTLTVEEKTVEIEGTLPWAALLFKGKIESTLRERASALLA